ncbi:UvrD-helicase domain-containing protein [Candidatus Ferrigenium straubiae]|jgi:DNA helicase-2/ATP-dependent DNA helicase PcrA|uniref:UvrD-helicase domain-containing protein n=1 Tax=Candidatus Ferrigenium straubiae TaxID=2919506 RepID=UPI003F4AD5C2
MNSSLLSGLNPEQRLAVTLPHQSALILAGAGSGKTRVLTTRIAYLISTGQVSPHGILAVTFTNKAAKEMVTRLSAMLPINTRGMWIGTFHGLCNRMLRAHHREANLPQTFQILDSGDQLSAIKRVMKALNVDDEKYPPRELQNFISGSKEQGLRASEVEAYDPYTRRKVEIFAEYDAQCQREGVVDFSELLLRCYELLQRNAQLREHYQQRFRHILVDEFQDTNPLQYRWLKLLAGAGEYRRPSPQSSPASGGGSEREEQSSIFAVGDDDQSIYAFRGANVGNMQELLRDFHIESVIKLEQNYRSHANILDAANALIEHNRNRLGKNLWTAESGGEKLRVYEAATDVDEAGFIVDEIRQLKSEGINLKEIALLYRSNAQSRVLEHALVSAGLSYRVYGGLRFFERQEIKHALAYLRLMENGDDDNALLRIVNFPTRGIGARSIEQLQEAAKQNNTTLFDAAARAGGKVTAFVALIESLRSATRELPLPEIIDHVLQHSGLIAHYENEKASTAKRREAEERLENLNELLNAATLFVHENEDDSLTAFLTHASLEAGEHQAGDQDDALHLMTVHAAKGLEFHTVFITGLEEGLFPHQNSQNVDGGLDEERRLMYVAITRARRRLYLTFAQSRMLHGQVNYGMASSFLRELPEELLHWLTPRFAARKSFDSYLPATASTPAPSFGGGASPAHSSPWRIGQRVFHQKFGEGTITGVEGGGADARVQVNFKHAGSKWLALEYAKLTAVG